MSELPERLPSRPLRNWILAWHIHTGDPAEVIAKGFDLDPVLVADLLSGEVSLMLSAALALETCAKVGADQSELWPTALGASSKRDAMWDARVRSLVRSLAHSRLG